MQLDCERRSCGFGVRKLALLFITSTAAEAQPRVTSTREAKAREPCGAVRDETGLGILVERRVGYETVRYRTLRKKRGCAKRGKILSG